MEQAGNEHRRSKRRFSSILFLFTLAHAGNTRLPVLTIAAQ
jgi:hypothetical protein